MEFSSQQFGASMEIEISDADKPDVIQGRIQELYGLLSNSIDAQLTGATQLVNTHSGPGLQAAPVFPQHVQPPVQQTVPQRPAYTNGRNRVASVTTGSNGNGRRGVNATEAQQRAIYAICKAQGLDMAAVLADFNVADARDLHVKDASRLIDQLKQNGNGTAA